MIRYSARRTIIGLTAFLLAGLTSFREPNNAIDLPRTATINASADHRILDRLLKKYVDERGLIDYRRLKIEAKELNRYLDLISKNPPTSKWSQNDQLAYWINA